jgi:putative ABC transport system permease protein
MGWINNTWSFFRGLTHRDARNRDLDDEVRAHAEMLADEKIQQGMDAREARRAARLEMGGIEQVKEEVRNARSGLWLETLWQDVRFATRMLRKNPGFTAVAVMTIALGIGANAAIFSVVNAVLLQPLPYPQPDRLVELERSYPKTQEDSGPSVSIPKFMVWREQTQVFQAVAAYDIAGPGINLTGIDIPAQVKGIHASADYFAVFGAPLAAGRTYTSDEDRPGGPHVVVISNGLWRGRFGGDPAIIGKTIELTGDPYQIIGVLGPSFKTEAPLDVWLPLQADPNSTDQGHYLLCTARLGAGVTLAQANAAMKVAAEEFRRKFPGPAMDANESAAAIPLVDLVVKDVRPALLILLGAVGFVLLIACANVASLQLARAAMRKREIAIRTALGAGRRRIVCQLLTESALLSLAGGALGLILGYAGVRASLAANSVDIPRIGDQGSGVTLDWRVLAFTLLVALVTGIVFGLIPAFSGSRSDLNTTLKENSSRGSSGFRQNKTRSILVVTEMALALILLVGAALLLRTFETMRSEALGFDARNVLTMEMSLSGTRFEKRAGVDAAVREVERRVDALPGVEAVASTCCLPVGGLGVDLPFAIEGQTPADGSNNGDEQWRDVSSQYFQVFRIPLLSGRPFTDRDDAGSDHIVVINDAMAKMYWPKGDAIGARITIGHGVGPEFEEPPRQIVGIVGDVRDQGLDRDLTPIMYVPESQVTDGVTALETRVLPVSWVIRTKAAPFTMSGDIQRELRVATGGLPVAHIRTMDQVIGDSTAIRNFGTMLLTLFAVLALLLAAIGIYGLMAYSVQQRTQEIGIRMALGASPESVRKMVVFQGMWLAAIGVVIGVAAALGLTRFMAGLIYGVKTWDPAIFVTVAVLLSVVSWFATYIPARRASRVNPVVSLRYE